MIQKLEEGNYFIVLYRRNDLNIPTHYFVIGSSIFKLAKHVCIIFSAVGLFPR